MQSIYLNLVSFLTTAQRGDERLDRVPLPQERHFLPTARPPHAPTATARERHCERAEGAVDVERTTHNVEPFALLLSPGGKGLQDPARFTTGSHVSS